MRENVQRVACSLHTSLRLRKGDVLLMLFPNCPEYVFISLGAVAIGVIVSSASPVCTHGECQTG